MTDFAHKYVWYEPSIDQNFLIDLCIVSSGLFSDVLDVRVKQVLNCQLITIR